MGTNRSRNGTRRAMMWNLSAKDYAVRDHLNGVTVDNLFTRIGKGTR